MILEKKGWGLRRRNDRLEKVLLLYLWPSERPAEKHWTRSFSRSATHSKFMSSIKARECGMTNGDDPSSSKLIFPFQNIGKICQNIDLPLDKTNCRVLRRQRSAFHVDQIWPPASCSSRQRQRSGHSWRRRRLSAGRSGRYSLPARSWYPPSGLASSLLPVCAPGL